MSAGESSAGESSAVERLVDRCLLAGFTGTQPPDWLRRVAPGLGGVVLYGPNLPGEADTARIASVLHADSDVLLILDEEGGDVTRLHYRSGATTPGNYVLGAADDLAYTEATAARIATELRAAGVLFNLAPDADVNSDPENPVIGVRSFGSDPDLVSRHTAAWIRAHQALGVAACAKHFPGHGDTRTDSHHSLPVVGCTEQEWYRLHRPPFEAAVRAGVRAVMTAHLELPAFDGAPATMSPRILNHLLRGELGFDGLIVTDALDMQAVAGRYGEGGAAVRALAAGADAMCLGYGGEQRYRQVREAVLDAVRTGDLSMSRLADAAQRVDALRAWTAAAAAAPVPDDSFGAILAATRRAARANRLSPLAGRPLVVEMRQPPNLAVGDAVWDLGGPLAELGLPPLLTVQLAGPPRAAAAAWADIPPDAPAEPLADVFAAPPGQPVVVVGRDVARHPWQRDIWRQVNARHPASILVDLGLPRADQFADIAYVLVGGAARPNLRVAAELLVRGSGTASPASSA